MARKVPWSTTGGPLKSATERASTAKALKRESTGVTAPDTEQIPEHTLQSQAEQAELKHEETPPRKKRRSSHSPSTSPIRGPPNASPMRPGYHADDIYMMVEDELQETAQKFTHHLHAAEYKRLKHRARETPTVGLPALNGEAPKSVKRKHEVLALEERQRTALADEEDNVGGSSKSDPWTGTSLAGLMGSTSQPRRTLLGSQEVQSSTRAASGFGRGEGESPRGKTTKRSILDPSREIESKEHMKRLSRPTHADSEHQNHVVKTSRESTLLVEPDSTSTNTAKSTRPTRKKFAFDDGFDIEALDVDATPREIASPVRARRKVNAREKGGVEQKQAQTKTNLSDIPVFLV